MVWVPLTEEWMLIPDTVAWVSQKLLISWDFHAQQSLDLRMVWKTTSSDSSVGENALLMREVRGERPNWFKKASNSNSNNNVLQLCYAEDLFWTHNTSNLEVDGLQKTTPGSIPVS